MHFEHLIEINDPQNPLLATLNRAQIWAGLRYRIQDPTPFLPGLEHCLHLGEEGGALLRELNFGSVKIQDRVTFAEEQWVRFDILPSATHAGGSLTITIEAPEPEHLFLRFAYQTTFASQSGGEDEAYIEYVKAAYHQSDLDCVRILRTLAATGKPN